MKERQEGAPRSLLPRITFIIIARLSHACSTFAYPRRIINATRYASVGELARAHARFFIRESDTLAMRIREY
jgi:hypothetical protein